MDTPMVEVTLAKLALRDKTEAPPCRCEFVYKWLDDHVKYFPCLPPVPEPRMIPRLCAYSYGPAQVHYFYSPPMKSFYPPKNIQLPFIVPAPHRISLLRPTYL